VGKWRRTGEVNRVVGKGGGDWWGAGVGEAWIEDGKVGDGRGTM
jgi:hypothetical protein